MTRVWDHSRHSGAALLLLLALADSANEDGVCWPSLRRLGERTRLPERSVVRVMHRLVESGELEVIKAATPRSSRVYHLTAVGDDTGSSQGTPTVPSLEMTVGHLRVRPESSQGTPTVPSEMTVGQPKRLLTVKETPGWPYAGGRAREGPVPPEVAERLGRPPIDLTGKGPGRGLPGPADSLNLNGETKC